MRLCRLSLLVRCRQFVSLYDFDTVLGCPQSVSDVLSLPFGLLRLGAFRSNLSITRVGFSATSPVPFQTRYHLVPSHYAPRRCTNHLLCIQERLNILGKSPLLLTPRLQSCPGFGFTDDLLS